MVSKHTEHVYNVWKHTKHVYIVPIIIIILPIYRVQHVGDVHFNLKDIFACSLHSFARIRYKFIHSCATCGGLKIDGLLVVIYDIFQIHHCIS